MNGHIWVIVEEKEGTVKSVSYEVLSLAKRLSVSLNSKVYAVILGNNVDGLAKEMLPYGIDTVYVLDDPMLSPYTPDGYVQALHSLYKNKERPCLIMAGATVTSKDYLPKLAALIGTEMVSDCTDVNIVEDDFEFKRPVYAGKAFCTLAYQTEDVRVATIRPNAVKAAEPDSRDSSGEIVKVDIGASDSTIRTKVVKLVKSVSADIDLTEARIIVSGGRGMKGPDNFSILEELAGVIGGVVGASRAAVDAGWRGHQYQVGQTGKTVSPDLYIACGISGAIQHLAGMSSSKCIVAINADSEANIFKVCDYGIVGDLFEIVPILTSELKDAVQS